MSIIKYSSNFNSAWKIIVIYFILIISLVVPYQICFQIFRYDYLYWLITAVLLLDVIICFNSEVKLGVRILKNREEIRKYYLKKWFIIDLISALPLAYFAEIIFQKYECRYSLTIIIILQLLRLTKFLKAFMLFEDIQNALNAIPSIMRLSAFLFLIFMQSVNIMALGWVFIGAAGDPKQFSNIELYIRGLYWCITTITTIGYGDYSPDKNNNLQIIYTMFVQIMGAGIFSYIIGNVAGLIANLDVAKANYMKKIEEISVFMKSKNIPENIQKKVKNYYEYSWETNKNITETSIMQELPHQLSLEIALFLNRGILQKVSFFKNASEIFIREIVQMLKPAIFIPGDFIIRQGEYGDCMYFLSSGEVEVLVNDNRVAVLREGSPCGETALLQGEKRNASIRAITYCDVYVLTKKDFDFIRNKYSDFNEQILKIIEERKTATKK